MIKWKTTDKGLKVFIPRPEDMNDAKWDKVCIRLARNLERLNVKVRRVSSADNNSEK